MEKVLKDSKKAKKALKSQKIDYLNEYDVNKHD